MDIGNTGTIPQGIFLNGNHALRDCHLAGHAVRGSQQRLSILCQKESVRGSILFIPLADLKGFAVYFVKSTVAYRADLAAQADVPAFQYGISGTGHSKGLLPDGLQGGRKMNRGKSILLVSEFFSGPADRSKSIPFDHSNGIRQDQFLFPDICHAESLRACLLRSFGQDDCRKPGSIKGSPADFFQAVREFHLQAGIRKLQVRKGKRPDCFGSRRRLEAVDGISVFCLPGGCQPVREIIGRRTGYQCAAVRCIQNTIFCPVMTASFHFKRPDGTFSAVLSHGFRVKVLQRSRKFQFLYGKAGIIQRFRLDRGHSIRQAEAGDFAGFFLCGQALRGSLVSHITGCRYAVPAVTDFCHRLAAGRRGNIQHTAAASAGHQHRVVRVHLKIHLPAGGRKADHAVLHGPEHGLIRLFRIPGNPVLIGIVRSRGSFAAVEQDPVDPVIFSILVLLFRQDIWESVRGNPGQGIGQVEFRLLTEHAEDVVFQAHHAFGNTDQAVHPPGNFHNGISAPDGQHTVDGGVAAVLIAYPEPAQVQSVKGVFADVSDIFPNVDGINGNKTLILEPFLTGFFC